MGVGFKKELGAILRKHPSAKRNTSTYFVGFKNGMFISEVGAHCYSKLTQHLETCPDQEIQCIWIWPDQQYEYLDWVKYIINDGWLSRCFKTKSVPHGYAYGFEMDLSHGNIYEVIAAMMALRELCAREQHGGHIHGNPNLWEICGASKEMALCLSVIWAENKGQLTHLIFNPHHFHCPLNRDFRIFSGEGAYITPSQPLAGASQLIYDLWPRVPKQMTVLDVREHVQKLTEGKQYVENSIEMRQKIIRYATTWGVA